MIEEKEKLRRAEANPQDPENQRYLEERIRQQNVEASFLEAQENFPEMFGTVVMLYIDVKVNGQKVKVLPNSISRLFDSLLLSSTNCTINFWQIFYYRGVQQIRTMKIAKKTVRVS